MQGEFEALVKEHMAEFDTALGEYSAEVGHILSSLEDIKKQSVKDENIPLDVARKMIEIHEYDNMSIFCAVITTSNPDYKRPSSSTEIKHFTSLEDAKKWLNDEKRKYYNDHCILGFDEEDFEIMIGDDENPSKYDQLAYEKIYGDSYMNMPPYDGYIIDVNKEMSTGNGIILIEEVPIVEKENVQKVVDIPTEESCSEMIDEESYCTVEDYESTEE